MEAGSKTMEDANVECTDKTIEVSNKSVDITKSKKVNMYLFEVFSKFE